MYFQTFHFTYVNIFSSTRERQDSFNMSKRPISPTDIGASGSSARPNSKKRRQIGKETENNGRTTENNYETAEQVEADVGIIESISLKNFMCHSKLDFDFGPNVNFVCGQNGSGKSAILTGLVLGLGGKANVTNRGTNIRGFIKTGKTYAVIKVELRNRGPDAYKSQEYGDKICIERRLSVDGTSSYKIKSTDNRVIANKKEELNKIVDQFNLQVGNPICVLNQETSRNFLNSKSPQDKYLFFLKATQLEEIKNNYSAACDNKNKAKALIIQKQEMLPILKKEMLQREQVYRQHLCLGEQRTKVRTLRREFSWAVVYEKENAVKQAEANVDKVDKYRMAYIEKLQSAKESVEQCKRDKANFKVEVTTIESQLQAQTPLIAEKKNAVRSGKEQLRQAQLNENKINLEIKTITSDLEAVAERIKELRSVNEHDYLEEKQIRLKKIESLEAKRTELLAQQRTTENHFQQLEQSISHFQDHVSNMKLEERALITRLRSLTTELKNLESSRTNRFMRFGEYMPKLLDQIEAAFKRNKFICKPLGPIGAIVSLKDPKWASIVEACLGQLLTSFCCDNHQDEKVLYEIFKNTIPNTRTPNVIVSKFLDARHDTRNTAVRTENHPSVLEVLEIPDTVVANFCIDQRHIEKVLLIGKNETARQLLMKDVPRNCFEAYTLCGDQVFPSPNFRYYSAAQNPKAHYLSENVEEKINEIREEIITVQENSRKIASSLFSGKSNLDENINQKSITETNLTKILQNLQKLNFEINNLKNIEDPSPTDITVLEEDIVQHEGRRDGLVQDLEGVKEKKSQIEDELRKVTQEFKDLNDQMIKLSKIVEPLKEKVEQSDQRFEECKELHHRLLTKLKEFEKKLDLAKSEKERIQNESKDFKVMALKVGPKMETERTSRDIESEISALEKQLEERERQSGGNKEEITLRYSQAKTKYFSIKKEIEDIEFVISTIDKGLLKRRNAFKEFRDKLVFRLKVLFKTALMVRKYSGSLEFSHAEKSLKMHVQPSEDVQELHTDMKSLSGGERSFSTVCFIIALWDAMECPFRILDEYDVFMDMVNRRISMGLMLDTALQNLHHQFLFLTPLDMPVAITSPLVNICMMPDPVRDDATREEQGP